MTFITISITGHADCTKLPAPVADRIGRVVLALDHVPNKTVLAGKYDIIWADYFYKPGWAKLPGTYSIKYMTVDRDPNPNARVPNPAADGYTKSRDLRWYHRNHPNWVVYKCPDLPEPKLCERPAMDSGPNNPAYQCFFPNSVDYMPLDITNPSVREFLFDANLGGEPYLPPFKGYIAHTAKPVSYPSILSSGFYDAVGVDNLANLNSFGECGIYEGGKFVRRYSGGASDSSFLRARIAWINWLGKHVRAAGLCLAGNDYFTTRYAAEFLEIASTLDIVVDEHGFTRDSGPLEVGAAWLTRVATLRKLTKSGKPLIDIEYVSPTTTEPKTRENLLWALANYLLVKADRTYLALSSPKEGPDPAKSYPELFIETGAPTEEMQTNGTLYWRHFQKALAVVNPSPKADNLGLGQQTWHGLYGDTFSGSVLVGSATALVLITGK